MNRIARLVKRTNGERKIEAPFLDPVFVLALVVFALPALFALTTYPSYYEDESWIYLPVFEALRGNGFSWAAFHEGSSVLGTMDMVATFLMWLSPLSPETTVRAISFLFAFSCLPAVFLLARTLDRSKAYLAPVVLVLIPLWYVRVRYGRNDCVAIAFALWALVAAARLAPLSAGVLSGLAVSVHPVFIWVGPACVILLVMACPLREIRRYVAGGLLGITPQAIWIAVHFDSFRTISARYFVTASVNHGWAAWLTSLSSEFQRYRAYVAGLGPIDLAVQAVFLLALPAWAVVRSHRRQRPAMLALAVLPLLALALLVAGKNPLYFIYAFPALAVLSAVGARKLMPAFVRIACVAALVWSGATHVNGALQASREPSIGQREEQLSAWLPANAVVFSPLFYGGLLRRRPDLHFFTYHALSTRPAWGLPTCAAMAGTIRSLIEADPRPVPGRLPAPVETVFFLRWEEEEFLQYFRSIYVDATVADLRCALGPAKPLAITVCGTDPKRCDQIQIVSRAMGAPSGEDLQFLGDALRVHAGAGNYVDSEGRIWTEDTAYQEGAPFSTTAPISGTSDPVLYQTEHLSTRGILTHRFKVPNGQYRIVLKFAEIYFKSAGQRIFDVSINGKTERSHLDVFAEAGGANKALDLRYPAVVTNGVLVLTLRAVVGNPKINAIEIRRNVSDSDSLSITPHPAPTLPLPPDLR